MKITSPIHLESIEYISNHINAKTSEIPKHLLEYWHTPEDVADYFEKSADLHCFLIFQHAVETYNKTLGKELSLSPIEAMALFSQYQFIIGTVLGRKNDVKINPVDLFDFVNYSNLNITIL